MTNQHSGGVVSISIDVETGWKDGSPCATPGFRDLIESTAGELIDRFNKHRIAASWTFRNPGNCAIAAALFKSSSHHEVALSADEVASRSDSSRSDLMRSVVRPLQSALDAGMTISTLASTTDWRPRHI